MIIFHSYFVQNNINQILDAIGIARQFLRDRTNILHALNDEHFIDKYRFSKDSVILDMMGQDLEMDSNCGILCSPSL